MVAARDELVEGVCEGELLPEGGPVAEGGAAVEDAEVTASAEGEKGAEVDTRTVPVPQSLPVLLIIPTPLPVGAAPGKVPLPDPEGPVVLDGVTRSVKEALGEGV